MLSPDCSYAFVERQDHRKCSLFSVRVNYRTVKQSEERATVFDKRANGGKVGACVPTREPLGTAQAAGARILRKTPVARFILKSIRY
jgi:hypothetical protein